MISAAKILPPDQTGPGKPAAQRRQSHGKRKLPDSTHRCQGLPGSAAWSDLPRSLRPGIFPATRGPVPGRGRHPGPGHRTPGTPADTYAGVCRSPGYIRCGLQRKGTSGSSKFVTILCWSIVGGKRLCVFRCFRNSREKCVNHLT